MGYEDISEWALAFRRSRAGRQALETLADLKGPGDEEQFSYFELFCLSACHKAASGAYDWRQHQIELYRQYPADARRAIRAAEELAGFLKKHGAARWALFAAGRNVILDEQSKGGQRKGSFGALLGFVHATIEKFPEPIERTISSRPDPRMGRGLDYGKPMARQARTPDSFAVDGLVFWLTCHCRDWTGLGHVRIMSPGHSLPIHGRPCSAAVAQMVNATLGTALSGTSVADMLKKRLKDAHS